VNRLMLWGLHGADVSLVLTEHWKRYYAEELGFPIEKLAVLPNPTYPPAEIPARRRGEHVKLLFLGRMGERKGTFDIIRAFASLPQSVRRQCRLMMAGDGEIERARELVRSLGCDDQITLNSWLGPEDVRRALAESDVFLLPSHGEGMSNAVLEAMSWGLAIITSREGGIDEFLHDGHSALLIRPGDVGEIARAIERLVTDDGLRRSIGRHARRAAIPLDLRHHVDHLVDIYYRVARQPIDTLGARESGAAPSRVAGTVG
jgi:glycosyltransferase involved in cell wall biosynthesis